MTETPNPQSDRPNDMHWGISYLREDIQDLRQEARQMTAHTDARFAEVNERMDARFAETNARIDATNMRIDTTNTRMDTGFAEVNRRLDARFALLLTMMVAMTGVLLAAIKL